MVAHVIAETPDQYKAWLTQQAADIKESQALLSLERKTRGQGGP
jgi:heme/copper-type cytochrome/quinol oxidase subunit 2